MKIFTRYVENHPLRHGKSAWECKSGGNLITTSIVSEEECLRRHREKLEKKFKETKRIFLKTIDF